jgi:SGT1 protein
VSAAEVDDMLSRYTTEVGDLERELSKEHEAQVQQHEQPQEGVRRARNSGGALPPELRGVLSSLDSFLDAESSVDGVLQRGEGAPGEGECGAVQPEDYSDLVHFDQQRFVDVLQRVLGLSEGEFHPSSGVSGGAEESRSYAEEVRDAEFLREAISSMDAELSRTSLGESFERQPRAAGTPAASCAHEKGTVAEEEPREKRERMHEKTEAEAEAEAEEEEVAPIALDLNLMKNLLASLDEQPDALGPFATLLQHAPAAEDS